MSLVGFVESTVQATMPLLSGGSVVFKAPAAEVRPVAPDGTLAAVVNGAHLAGATSVSVRNDDGDGLAASVPAGSVVTLGGTPYSVTSASVKVDVLTLELASPLTADLADGDPVVFSAATFTVASSATVSKMSYFPADETIDVSWAFQISKSDITVIPEAGWHVTRTLASGQVLRGVVVDVDAPDAVALIYVGTRK